MFSKRMWAVPVRTKSGRDATEAFEKILVDGRIPNMVQSDKGTEFFKFVVSVEVESSRNKVLYQAKRRLESGRGRAL